MGDTAVAPPNISQPPTRTAIGVPRRLASSFPAPPRPTQSRERGPGCAAPSARPHSSSATAPLRSSARGLEPATSSYALARAESYGGTDTESVPLRRPKHPSHSTAPSPQAAACTSPRSVAPILSSSPFHRLSPFRSVQNPSPSEAYGLAAKPPRCRATSIRTPPPRASPPRWTSRSRYVAASSPTSPLFFLDNG